MELNTGSTGGETWGEIKEKTELVKSRTSAVAPLRGAEVGDAPETKEASEMMISRKKWLTGTKLLNRSHFSKGKFMVNEEHRKKYSQRLGIGRQNGTETLQVNLATS